MRRSRSYRLGAGGDCAAVVHSVPALRSTPKRLQWCRAKFVPSSVGCDIQGASEGVEDASILYAYDAKVVVCRTFQSLLYLALHFTTTQT